MRIESDIEKALGSEDSEPSVSSEYEVMSPHLMERFSAESIPSSTPVPAPAGPARWIIAVAVGGIVLSLGAALVLAFGGVIVSALAFLFA